LRAAVVEKPGKISVRDVPDPAPAAGQVLVRVEWVSICGSDHHAYLGEFGERVRFPAILGHEFSGEVVALGPGVQGLRTGARVVVDPVLHCGGCPACRQGKISSCRSLKLLGIDLPGGFGELVAAPAHTVFPVPEGLSLRLGPLVELTSIACHAAARARYAPGESVAVFGAGKLGLAVITLLARSSPARLVAVDLDPGRLELAKKLGASDVIDVREADPVARIRDLTGGDGVDLAFEAVGAWREVPGRRPPVTAAAEAIRHGGRLLVLGQGPLEQPVAWKSFVWKEAEIIASRVNRGEFPRAIQLVASGRLPVGELVTHEMSVEQAPEAFRMLDEHAPGVVKILLRHGSHRK
jgi:threonine dehydrogenase-like Zn-dependent dehydrogenase